MKTILIARIRRFVTIGAAALMLSALSGVASALEALQDNHLKSDFITLPGAGHGFRGADAEKAQAALLSWFLLTLTK